MVFKGIGFNDSSGLLTFITDESSLYLKVKDILLEIKLESRNFQYKNQFRRLLFYRLKADRWRYQYRQSRRMAWL